MVLENLEIIIITIIYYFHYYQYFWWHITTLQRLKVSDVRKIKFGLSEKFAVVFMVYRIGWLWSNMKTSCLHWNINTGSQTFICSKKCISKWVCPKWKHLSLFLKGGSSVEHCFVGDEKNWLKNRRIDL